MAIGFSSTRLFTSPAFSRSSRTRERVRELAFVDRLSSLKRFSSVLTRSWRMVSRHSDPISLTASMTGQAFGLSSLWGWSGWGLVDDIGVTYYHLCRQEYI